MSTTSSEDSLMWLARLVSIGYVVETLDALANRPHTLGDLHTTLHTSRGHVATALRALAADGAVRRHPGTRLGSWDTHEAADMYYELTDRGRVIAELLGRLEIWETMYTNHLTRQTYEDAPPNRRRPPTF